MRLHGAGRSVLNVILKTGLQDSVPPGPRKQQTAEGTRTITDLGWDKQRYQRWAKSAPPRIWCRSGPDAGNGIGLEFMGGWGKTRGFHKHARPYVWRLAVLKQLADGANLIWPFPESSVARALHSGRLRKRAEG